jgi:hypothetical protein
LKRAAFVQPLEKCGNLSRTAMIACAAVTTRPSCGDIALGHLFTIHWSILLRRAASMRRGQLA